MMKTFLRLVAICICCSPAFAPAATMVFDSNAAGAADATIAGGGLTNNPIGISYTGLEVSGTYNTDGSRSLLKFDVNALAGQYNSIDSISLRLTTSYNVDGAGPVNIHQVLVDWIESQVTWADRQTLTPWTTPGGEFDASLLGTIDLSPLAKSSLPNGVQEQVTVNLLPGAGNAAARKALIDAWTSGANYGMLLGADTLSSPNPAFAGFRDRSRLDADDRPMLTIEFTAPLPPIPEPGSMTLLAGALGMLAVRRRRRG